MYLIAIFVVAALVLIVGLLRMRQLRRRRELEQHSIDVDELHALLESKKDVVLLMCDSRSIYWRTRRLFRER